MLTCGAKGDSMVGAPIVSSDRIMIGDKLDFESRVVMESKLEKEVRILKAYTASTTVLLAVFALAAFAQNGWRKFEEIDVERVNVVEKNGQIKMVISNKARLPGPGNIASGKLGQREGLKGPGILFYNEKGDECGGLQYISQEQEGTFVAGSLLAFDKYAGDQVIGLKFEENNAKRKVGLNVWDQPDVSAEAQNKNWNEAQKLEPGPERDALMQQAVAYNRVFVGRSFDKSATVTLFDPNGRPRVRMAVGPDGEPKLEFLDAGGKVLQTLPSISNSAGKP